MKIEFIYFDLGGVVFRWSHGLEKIATITNRETQEIKSIFDKFDYEVCLGKISPQTIWEKYSNGNTKDINFTTFWSDLFIPINETHKLILELNENFDLGIITNIYSGILEQAFQKNKVPSIEWKSIIESCEIGMAKPDEKIFTYAQQQAGVHPNSLLLIDDNEMNIKAAKSLGWQTYLFLESSPIESVEKIKKLL